ncbi:MAG: hypothetical protein ACFFFH_18500, partial [Candidatus Thorarchaeota archaeon]
NLDAKLRVEMRGEIIRLQKQLETTLCYVTHDQVEAMSMADRIAIINKGVIQQVGTPFDVYNHPSNVFVAGFIGSPSMNFTSGMVLQEGSEYFLDFIGGKLKLTGKRAEAAREFLKKCREEDRKSRVVVGIRPEHLFTGYKPEDCECITTESDVSERVETPTKDSENVLNQGTVFVVEHLGAGTYVTLQVTLESHTKLQLEMGRDQERIGIMVDGYFDTNLDETLYVRFYEPYIHLFDADSEENILNLI